MCFTHGYDLQMHDTMEDQF